MRNYTPSTSTFSNSIQIVETTDAVSADNATAAVKQLIENDIAMKESVDLLIQNSTKLTDVSGAAASTTAGIKSVTVKWSDPQDVTVDGAVIAEWAGTILARKAGSAPTGVTDGTQLINNTVRNSYASSGYVDGNVEYGTTYYYRFFPYTALGTHTAGTSVSATPAKALLPIPTPSTTLTYDASSQTMTFSGYDSTKMSVSGDSATDAGSHTATFALTSANHTWSDGTTTPKDVTWTIDKATGSVTLSSYAIELDADNVSDTVTVTSATGSVTGASSSDDTVCTASYSGNTITLNSVDAATGTATVTVNIGESTNYLATTATISVNCTFTTVYGASWDGTSTTSWSRTDAAAGFTDPVPYVSGSSSYGSPFDALQPWAGMTKEERTGGTMVKIPKFYYKITQNGAGMKIQIADGPMDGFSASPAHMDRGDGNGERDYVYVGRFHCGATAFKSVTGQSPKNNTTRANFRTSIHNLGSNIWQMDFATRFTIWLLYIVEFADWNSQAKIGYGCGNNSSAQAMGYTDSMPYHTGTTQSNRTTYGLGTQYRYIEGLWDNVYDWVDGCYYNSSGLNIILNPSNFSDSANGISAGTPSSGCPSAFTRKDVASTFEMFIPTAASGDNSTYSCDYWSFGASSPCLYAGGDYGQDLNHGLFCVGCSGASFTYADRGSRLMELP